MKDKACREKEVAHEIENARWKAGPRLQAVSKYGLAKRTREAREKKPNEAEGPARLDDLNTSVWKPQLCVWYAGGRCTMRRKVRVKGLVWS